MNTTSNEKVLKKMLEDFKHSSEIFQPSLFWHQLNDIHLKQLSDDNIKNFKRSINGKYFGFGWNILGIYIHEFPVIISQVLKGNFKPFTSVKFNDFNKKYKEVKKFDPIFAYFYKVYVACLFDFVSKFDHLNLFGKIKEPKVGNPFNIIYKGKLISQDLCNSTYEFYSIMDQVDKKKIQNIVELGAGYGRTAYVFLKVLTTAKYTIVDIPPALFVSQWYISKVFPNEKIFYYRKFDSFKKVEKEFKSSRIRFLMADQIKLLPKKYFDLVVNISSLHEMRRDQIKNYLQEIKRIGKGFFYTKQWIKSRVSDNKFITKNEYPIPKNWKVVGSRSPHPVQSWFFDTLYKISK